MPRVSVLITTYNRPEMLEEAVESVLAQTYEDYEILILDDASSEPRQHEVLLKYWRHPKVRVYKDCVPDRGSQVRYAVLINMALKLARGEFVTYLCDDDLYLPERLELMVARLDQDDECKVVYGGQYGQNYGEESRWDVRPPRGVMENAYCQVDHSSVMHVTQVGLEVGGWDEMCDWKLGDAVFWNRLTGAGYKFYPVEAFTDVHRFWGGSVTAGGIPA